MMIAKLNTSPFWLLCWDEMTCRYAIKVEGGGRGVQALRSLSLQTYAPSTWRLRHLLRCMNGIASRVTAALHRTALSRQRVIRAYIYACAPCMHAAWCCWLLPVACKQALHLGCVAPPRPPPPDPDPDLRTSGASQRGLVRRPSPCASAPPPSCADPPGGSSVACWLPPSGGGSGPER